jgi:hypothetical protein
MDCNKKEEALHKRHKEKMISYEIYITSMSKNKGKIV